MVKAIFFDFWGTLVENGVWSPIKQVRTILRINAPFEEYVVKMEKVMMTKTFPTLRDAFQALCDEFHTPCSEEQMDALIGMWNTSWMLAKPYEEVLTTLKDLQQQYRLILVSNTDCFSIDAVLDKYQLRPYFELVVLSYEVGRIKTDDSFFPSLLEKMQLNPGDCLMIGDSIQSDIVPTQRAGMNAVLIDRRDSREFQPKIRSLLEIRQVLT